MGLEEKGAPNRKIPINKKADLGKEIIYLYIFEIKNIFFIFLFESICKQYLLQHTKVDQLHLYLNFPYPHQHRK